MIQYFPIVTGSLTVTGSVDISGSITTNSTITATTLVVQTITSSISSITGSTKWGSLSSNTHTFTGSMYVTGALYVPSGSVGVGTFSPNYDLHINNSSIPRIQLTNTTTGNTTGDGLHIYQSGNDSYILNKENAYLYLGTNNSVVVNITGSNVGIGTASPSGIFQAGVANAGIYFDVSTQYTPKIKAAGTISDIQIESVGNGGNVYLNAPGTTSIINFQVNSAERMRITSAGNVGIGTSSPSSVLSVASADNTSATNIARFAANNNTLAIGIGYESIRQTETGGVIKFETNATERMRITSAGIVQIGGTNAAPWNITSGTVSQITINDTTNGFPFIIAKNDNLLAIFNRVSSNGTILEFKYNGNVVGSISTNANSLPSDLNFKKDITNMSLGLNLVTKLRPVHYRHKFDNETEALSNGIIAQEMEEALSECGVENNSLLMLQHKPNEKENESQYWVDYTKMIPVLVKAIQELNTKFEEYKATHP